MNFSRSTYDIAVGEPMVLYQTTHNQAELCEKLNVGVGTGGGVISLDTSPREGAARFPSGVLVCKDSHRAVGLLAIDFAASGKFGIIESDAKRIALAEAVGIQYDLVTYETSIQKFG